MVEPPPPPPPGPGDPTEPLPVEPLLEPPLEPPPPPLPPEPPPGRAIWPWLLLLLLLVLVGLGALLFVTHHGHKKHATTKAVPAVVGLTKQAATTRLKQSGFVVQIRPVASSKPKDVVVAQAPQPGAKLSPGGLVALTVSAGPPKQGVPDVVGLKVSEAITRLRAAHLDSRQKIVFAREAPGTVVKQTPAAGATVKKGSPVLLEVSKGPQKVAVPAVVGQKRADAVAALKQAGLVAAIFSVPSTQPKGFVVAQDPQAGTKAPKGSRVRLNVSQGQPATTGTTSTATTTVTTSTGTTGTGTTSTQAASVTVPNVVGQKQLAAQRRLQGLGLGVRTFYVPSTKPRGTVVAQRPAPGTTVKSGSRVRINVSNGPHPQPLKAVPDVTGEDEATATSDLQAAGFQVQVVDEPTTDQNQDGTVLDEDPVPGTRIPSGSQVTIYVGRFSG